MKIFVKSICMFAFIVLLAVPQVCLAEDLMIQYSILDSETYEDGTVQGRMQVSVFNQTAADLYNVDLRLDKTGSNYIEKGVYQFGSIPAGKGRFHDGSFMFSEEFLISDPEILWQVDYDNSQGAHTQTFISATAEMGGTE